MAEQAELETVMCQRKHGGYRSYQAARALQRLFRPIAEQQRQLPDLLAQGAEAFGYRGQVWTTERVAEVIERTFGVKEVSPGPL